MTPPPTITNRHKHHHCNHHHHHHLQPTHLIHSETNRKILCLLFFIFFVKENLGILKFMGVTEEVKVVQEETAL